MNKSTAPLSRRRFIGTGTALLATAWCASPSLLAADKPESVRASIERFSGFKMGLQGYSLRRYGLAEVLEHTADLGLHWIEFYPRQFSVTTDVEDIRAMKERLEPYDIRMYVHGVNRFGGNEERNRRVFEFAKLAGIQLLSADPSSDSFPILHDLVQEYDIRVGIHNHGPRHTYDRATDMLEAVERWDKRIGFCPDTGHSMRSGEDPVEMVRVCKDRLYGMHLKDHDGIHRNNPAETILGEGALDLEAFCSALREIGYNKPISLEYELDNPVEGLRAGLENFARAAAATA